jgi:hypothetical protein
MRKVLLTTTALVALGGVSAASAIDISGTYMFDYTDTDNSTVNSGGTNNSSMGSDARIVFSGETTSDAGVTFGGSYALSAAGAVEDQGLYMSGDFGYIMAGATDGVVDGMDNFMNMSSYVEYGAGTAQSGNSNVALNTGAGMSDTATAEKVGYRSPEINGLQFGVSFTDAGRQSGADNTQWMVTYDFGLAKVGYGATDIDAASNNGATTGQTQAGFGTTISDINIRYGYMTDKVKGANGAGVSSDIKTSDIGIIYSGIENITLYYEGVSSKEKVGTNQNDKMDSNAFGLSYAIAPGVSALVENTSADYTDADGTNTDSSDTLRLGLSVNF